MVNLNVFSYIFTVLVDFSGFTYLSLNGSCVSKKKTVTTQTPRCILCNESSYIRSAYFGAEENKLSFDTYLLKLVDITVLI